MRNPILLLPVFFLLNHFTTTYLAAQSRPEDVNAFMVFEGREINQEEATKLFTQMFNVLVENEQGQNARRFLDLNVSYAENTISRGLPSTAWRMLSLGQDIVRLSKEKRWLPVAPDSQFMITALMAKCAMDETEADLGFKVATYGRRDVFDLLREKNDYDPQALQILMQHLRCMAGKYIKEDEELVADREKLFRALPGKGGRQKLRSMLCRENIRELGTLYLWKYDYANAERVFAKGQEMGDPTAKAQRIICLIWLNRYQEAETLIKESMGSKDFEALFYATEAYSFWQRAAKDFNEADKTLESLQVLLDYTKLADAVNVKSKSWEGVHLLQQWYLSLDKMRNYAVQSKMWEAQREASVLNRIMILWTARIFGSTSEKERLRFRQIIETSPFDLGYITSQPKLLADNLALYKGLVADSLLIKRPEPNPESYLQKGYPAELASDLARADTDLLKVDSVNLNAIDSEAVLRRLPPRTTLVDLAKCGGIDERGFNNEKIVAIVYNKGVTPSLQMVDLGDAGKIETLVAEYLALVESSTNDDSLADVSKKLYVLSVEPWLARVSPKSTEVIICPDGSLSFVNFSALPDSSGKFLGEKIAVSYIAAARDLFPPKQVKLHKNTQNKLEVRIFADPDYKAPWSAKLFSLFGTRRNMTLNALPETREEALAICRAFGQTNKDVKIFSGLDATEENVRKSKGAFVLHLGTHGFFNHRALENPMRANGLAFAGAFSQFKPGLAMEYPENPRDGILTAEEISRIDLSSCLLVSVSACQSGMGKTYNGEGVLGIRRGFIQAGASNLLLCLWPVGDREARIFIEHFYDLIGKNLPAKEAYSQTMAALIRKAADEKGISYAIRAVGPFVMNSVWKNVSEN